LMVEEPQEAKTHGQDKDQETDEAEMLGVLHAVLVCQLTLPVWLREKEIVTTGNLPRTAHFSSASTDPYHIYPQALMPIGPITWKAQEM
jgi:hypothetical protein